MKKWIYLMCAGAFLIVLAVMIVFYVKINSGDAIKKASAVVWTQVDSNHSTTMIEKVNYYDAQQALEQGVQSWCRENPSKQVTGVSLKVILTVGDREKK